MGGISPIELCVRSSLIFSAPGFNHNLGFLQGQKPVLGQALTQKLPIEALDKGVLHRLPRLNEVQVHAILRGPGSQRDASELRIVVENQGLWQRPCEKQPIQNPTYPHSANRHIHFNL